MKLSLSSRILTILLLTIVGCSSQQAPKTPVLQKGVIDLRTWDLSRDGNVSLEGEWQFYHGKFLTGAGFDSLQRKNYLYVPGTWKGAAFDSRTLPSTGIVSYRLIILLPRRVTPIGIRIQSTPCAYVFFANGDSIGACGTLGTDYPSETPKYLPQFMELYSVRDTLECIVWVSNFHYWKGGLGYSPQIGIVHNMRKAIDSDLSNDVFVAGALAIMSIAFFFFYFFRRKDSSALYFSLFLLFGLLRVASAGETILLKYIPNLDWEILIKIELMSFYSISICFLLYIRSLFEHTVNKRVNVVAISIFLLFNLCTLVTPAHIHSHIVIFTQGWAVLCFIFLLISILRAFIKHQEGATSVLVSISILMSAFIIEALYHQSITSYYIPAEFGLLFFIVAQMLIIARRYALAFRRIENFSKELQVKVEERTQEMKTAQAQLIHSEKMATLGELTAGIAHEIKNPLNFINNFSELSNELVDELRTAEGDEKIETIDMLRSNLSKIQHHGKRADSIIQSMMQHARGGTGERYPTDINRLLEETINLVYHGMRAQNPSFNIAIEKKLDPALREVSVMRQDLGRVIINLMTNALYAVMKKAENLKDGYQPIVEAATRQVHDRVEIRIRDNGPGIPTDIREKIFQPFFTTKPTGEGTGLGLSMSYDIIVNGHGGTLTCENNGGGAEFVIMLPVQ